MNFEILNIGTGKSVTTNQLIDICEKVSGRKANIENVSAVAGDAIYAGIADCKKIKKLLGWEAKINLEDGIEKTYEYMLKKFLNKINNINLNNSNKILSAGILGTSGIGKVHARIYAKLGIKRIAILNRSLESSIRSQKKYRMHIILM